MQQLEPGKAREIVESGVALPSQPLIDLALTAHPGGTCLGFEYFEDEEISGRYYLGLEVEDTSAEVWEMTLDAQTGEILENEGGAE